MLYSTNNSSITNSDSFIQCSESQYYQSAPDWSIRVQESVQWNYLWVKCFWCKWDKVLRRQDCHGWWRWIPIRSDLWSIQYLVFCRSSACWSSSERWLSFPEWSVVSLHSRKESKSESSPSNTALGFFLFVCLFVCCVQLNFCSLERASLLQLENSLCRLDGIVLFFPTKFLFFFFFFVFFCLLFVVVTEWGRQLQRHVQRVDAVHRPAPL